MSESADPISRSIIHSAVLIHGEQAFKRVDAPILKELPGLASAEALPSCGREPGRQISDDLSESLQAAVTLATAPQLKDHLNKAREVFNERRLDVTWSRPIPRPRSFQLFEMCERVYADENSHLSWAPRRLMFRAAMGLGERGETFNNIFSLSIVPTDPTEKQTLFYKHTYKDEPLASYGNTSSSQWHTTDNCGVNPVTPIKTFERRFLDERRTLEIGFLKPYPTFKAEDLIPEVDPATPPQHVTQIRINRVEDVPPAVEDLPAPDLRARVQFIAQQFLLDQHSSKMLIVTVHAAAPPQDRIKYTLFLKG